MKHIVSITLTGEVTSTYPKRDGWFWLFYSSDEYVEIELDALSPDDRKIVEEKLKVWKDEKNENIQRNG